MSSASSHLRHGYEVEWPQRLCSCGRVCDIKIVEKSEKNLGRYYYACPKESQKCLGFRGWCDVYALAIKNSNRQSISGNEGESSTANLMSPKSTNGHRGAETELERVSMDVARLKVDMAHISNAMWKVKAGVILSLTIAFILLLKL